MEDCQFGGMLSLVIGQRIARLRLELDRPVESRLGTRQPDRRGSGVFGAPPRALGGIAGLTRRAHGWMIGREPLVFELPNTGYFILPRAAKVAGRRMRLLDFITLRGTRVLVSLVRSALHTRALPTISCTLITAVCRRAPSLTPPPGAHRLEALLITVAKARMHAAQLPVRRPSD